ncbi:MAG: Asp-tRNA(Asn)/Glu-tRNA(Gln) amidotransferase subunit GatA [Pseudomonadota bacterium]|nr:Asp-tRNA(Asn)/Glu-tRNA(Gln) amidotransferase subunit GatA [Pseudomonadota bacterium]MDE3037043.1 Asp-tRNA(Asn)/Glu-tRNA(Gln) amidotransferase subunit GatA [Pseudomonadota bacterium]
MSDLRQLSLSDMRDGLRAKRFSAVELAEAHLDEIEKTHAHINAFITVTRDIALAQAKASDAKLAKGEGRGIEGVPVGVKDLFCTKDVLTTAASHILDGFKPQYESTVTQNIWNAGGVMLGKLNLDEFAMGSSNMTSYYGPVKSPWTKDGQPLVPGGSSGGSAAAVAAHLAPVALGTDTGGSIRQPASFCGIVGIKPTYGRCSRWGIVAFASSLDQAGPLTRNVRDAAIMLNVMCGHDVKDSTSAKLAVPDFEKALTGNVKGKKIGIPKEYRPDGMNPEILAMWDKGVKLLKEAGAEIVDISLPHTKYALATYYIVAPAECSSNLARYDGVRFGLRAPADSLTEMYEKTRAAGFGHEVKRRIMIGAYVLSAGYYDAYYKKAQQVRWLIANDFNEAFGKVDAILTPTAPSAAFGFDYKPSDPVEMYLNDVFTVPASLAGLPGISIPGGLNKEGLPLGLQLIGKAFDEETVLNVAHALENALQFKGRAA